MFDSSGEDFSQTSKWRIDNNGGFAVGYMTKKTLADFFAITTVKETVEHIEALKIIWRIKLSL